MRYCDVSGGSKGVRYVLSPAVAGCCAGWKLAALHCVYQQLQCCANESVVYIHTLALPFLAHSDFISRDLAAFATANPQLSIELSVSRNKAPVLRGEYGMC